MNEILTRIEDALAIPRNQPRDRHVIQEIPVQERPINNNNNNHENEVDVHARLMSEREQPNHVLVKINQNANEVLINMQQN